MQLLQAQAGHVTIKGFGNITIHVSCFVCDAPARAYIKQIKGHGGYYGCEKCKHKGKWYGRIVYPDVNASKRTDREFDLQTDKEYHQGFSPLGALNVNMVTQFPLDYMHMVCLGVMKRMLMYWVKSPVNKGIRFGHQTISEISRYLLRIRKFIPREFSRKPRSLLELDRWKATEFRLFLLYVGVVALKSNVVQKVYKHFLLFSVAIYCLASPEFYVTHADWAHEQLKLFILKAEEVFGKDFIVYNVHGLLHLSEDVKNFGPLDTFSAFLFENFLGQLKRLIPMFHLVEFTKERSPDGSMAQDIIPDNWVIGGEGTKCLWPPKGVTYKMVFNRYEPKQDWYQCDIRILYKCPDITTSSSEGSGPPKGNSWKKNSPKKAKMSTPMTVSPVAMNVLKNTDYQNQNGMASPFAGSGLNQITVQGGTSLKSLSGKNSIDDQTERVLDRMEKKIDKLFFLLETVREDLSAVQAQLQMKDMEEMQSNSNKIKYAALFPVADTKSLLEIEVKLKDEENFW
ncbi:transposase domain-containing protein [Biomphalaria pfeifferi]|uniref:Transposase domain-containing protein n=1 Tax=Biomphalaria pfeifferi TaxID=112525 RepID=A0AAD8BYQ7_BIOPF|nr:transposase domain-containing protein [Biomphalaria pfeifferi]